MSISQSQTNLMRAVDMRNRPSPYFAKQTREYHPGVMPQEEDA